MKPSDIMLSGPTLNPRSHSVKRLVMILHGYGADGDNLIGIAQMLASSFADTLWVAPNAPYPCEMGMGYQWFSLADRSPSARDNGVKSASLILDYNLERLMKQYSLAASQVALLGFSQGAMTSVYNALRRTHPVAGVVGFSGALLGESTMHTELKSRPDMCLIHGDCDEVVPYGALAHATQALTTAGVHVEAHTRPGLGHSIDEEAIEIAAQFLLKRFEL